MNEAREISICVVSDTHRQHREIEIPECDILIHCGDFCTFQNGDEEVLEDADEWFAECPAGHVIAIGGNHDFMLHNRKFRFQNAIFLEDRLLEIDGLRIYGSPWCPDLEFFAYFANEAELEQRWRAIPKGIDILVTHTPAHGVLDRPTSGTVNLGCPILREELERIQPRLHVFGHVHASHGQATHGRTHSINAAVVGGPDYEIRHGATMTSLRQNSEN